VAVLSKDFVILALIGLRSVSFRQTHRRMSDNMRPTR